MSSDEKENGVLKPILEVREPKKWYKYSDKFTFDEAHFILKKGKKTAYRMKLKPIQIGIAEKVIKPKNPDRISYGKIQIGEVKIECYYFKERSIINSHLEDSGLKEPQIKNFTRTDTFVSVNEGTIILDKYNIEKFNAIIQKIRNDLGLFNKKKRRKRLL